MALIKGGSIPTRAVNKLEAAAEATLDRLPPAGRARYADAYGTAVARAVVRTKAGSPPEVVAGAVLSALTKRRPKTHYPVGSDARMLLAMSGLLPDRLLDRVRFRVFGMPAGFGARRTADAGRRSRCCARGS